jgi:hypothetical protein
MAGAPELELELELEIERCRACPSKESRDAAREPLTLCCQLSVARSEGIPRPSSLFRAASVNVADVGAVY